MQSRETAIAVSISKKVIFPDINIFTSVRASTIFAEADLG
jgi:hypothetical protein